MLQIIETTAQGNAKNIGFMNSWDYISNELTEEVKEEKKIRKVVQVCQASLNAAYKSVVQALQDFNQFKPKVQGFIKNMCALEGMRSLPDGSVNLVLTDPPYGIASKKAVTKVGNKLMSTQDAWGNDFQDAWKDEEEYWLWLKTFIDEYKRVLKDDGSMILYLDYKLAGLYIRNIEKECGMIFKHQMIFKKRNPMFKAPNVKNYVSEYEVAVWFIKSKKFTFNAIDGKKVCYMKAVFEGNIGRKKTKHPCEKYSWMVEPIIKIHSNESDVILDTFSGSGSIAIRAVQLGRRCVGFEKNKKFFDMARTWARQEKLNISI